MMAWRRSLQWPIQSTANFNVPAVGEVVEIRFLHAFRESNALYQPVYLGPRKDIEQHECVLSQLKYKRQEEEDLC
jgi:bifunctional non-homologous end joining protein LigD